MGSGPGQTGADALFYSYSYPEPPGFAEARVAPTGARYNQELHEFVLPYQAMRAANDPDQALLDFAQSTYDAGAELGKWDRAALEQEVVDGRGPMLTPSPIRCSMAMRTVPRASDSSYALLGPLSHYLPLSSEVPSR